MAEGGPPGCLAAAAAFGQPLFKHVIEKAASLPRLCDVPRAPLSWADAQAAVQARDEEKRKKEQLKKDGAKSKGGKPIPGLPDPQQTTQPGTSVGAVSEASAFWMFVVSQREDFRTLSRFSILRATGGPAARSRRRITSGTLPTRTWHTSFRTARTRLRTRPFTCLSWAGSPSSRRRSPQEVGNQRQRPTCSRTWTMGSR